MPRTYDQKKRRQSQAETRLKITEAAVRLHQRQGILATSMNDIAEEAGVGKVTVYRHFPDIEAVTQACSTHFFQHNPPPDPSPWRDIEEPELRLKKGLTDIYRWFAATQEMMTSVYAEARGLPIMAPYHAHWALMRDILAEPWQAGRRGSRKDKRLHAAIALAIEFDVWRKLTHDEGLNIDDAVELASRLVEKGK